MDRVRSLRPDEHRIAWAIVTSAAVALALHRTYLAAPAVDDAAISVSYGITLLSGHGLRLNPASQVVEGFSSPLWILIIGMSVPLHVDPIRFASMAGLLAGILALPAFALWGPAADGRRLQIQDVVPAVFAATATPYAYWVSSGMETGLHALMLGITGAVVLREVRTGRGTASAIAFALLCITRPEGVLYVAIAASGWVAFRAQDRRPPGRQEARIAVTLAALLAATVALRWICFAAVLPNTYYAKRGWDFDAARYFSGFFAANAPIVSFGGLVVFASLGTRRVRLQGALAAGFLFAGGCFVWRFKGDWMREWRLFAPLVPCLGAASSAGLAGLRHRAPRVSISTTTAAWTRPIAIAAAVMLTAVAVLAEARISFARSRALRADPELPWTGVAGSARAIAPHFQSLGMRRPLLGYPDIGGLGLALPNAEVIDVALLADYTIARQLQDPAAVEDYLTAEGLPSYVDIHGPGVQLLQYPRFMARYQRLDELTHAAGIHSAVYVLRGLTPSEDPRCPGGKASVLSLPTAALAHAIERELDAGRAIEALALWRCARTYEIESVLPTVEWRESLALRAETHARLQLADHDIETALRDVSLATVITAGAPHRRRWAEQLRTNWLLFERRLHGTRPELVTGRREMQSIETEQFLAWQAIGAL